MIKILITVLICISISPKITIAENLDDDGVQITRMQWFNSQRSFPFNSIPQGSYSIAMKQMEAFSRSNGYFTSAENWVLIGPQPAYLGPAVSGRVSTIKFHPGDPSGNTIFIGGAEGGIWKTTDGGSTWSPKTDFLSTLSSGAIEIGPNSAGEYTNIYYGTGESHAGFNFCYFGDGFFKSTDNGETFYKIEDPNLPKAPTYFSRIVVRPGHPNEIFAACGTNHTNISYEAGLYKSTDYGETWLPRLVPDPFSEGRVVNDIIFSPDGSMAYIIGPDESSELIYEKGVHYRISTDGGQTFGPARDDIIIPEGRSHIALCTSQPNRVYIFTPVVEPCTPGSCAPNSTMITVFRSDDAGFSYTMANQFTSAGCFCNSGDAYQYYYDMFIACSHEDPDDIYVGLINMWKSTDGGSSFFIISPPHSDMQNFDINKFNSDQIALATDGGVYRSTDGGTGRAWINMNEDLTLTQFYRFASGTFNPDIIVAGAQDNGIQSKYLNNNAFRDVLGGGDGTAIYASKTEPLLMFANIGNFVATGPPPIMRTTDGGNQFWNIFDPPNSHWDSQNDWIAAITSIIDPSTGSESFFTARRQWNLSLLKVSIYKTTNNGDNWFELGNGIPVGDAPQNFATAPSNQNVIYLSTGSYAWPFVSQKLFRSPDGGSSWFEVINGSGTAIPNRYITHIEVDPVDENTVYVSLSGFNSLTPGQPGHVFMSRDGGITWQNMSGNMPDIPVNDLIIIKPGEKHLIAATDAGILINSSEGNEWIELGPGLPHSAVTDIEYNPFSGKLRAGTFGRGIFEFKLITGSYTIDHPVVLNSDENGLVIENDLVVTTGGKILIPKSCTVKMAAGKKIIIEKGGQISVTAPNVLFTSASGKWGGIEIKEYGFGSIKNCTFSNTETPLTISGNQKTERNVEISNCTFNKGSVIASGRKNITISSCTFNEGSPFTGTALSFVYCSNSEITGNNINSPSAAGITISNSTVEITGNNINNTGNTAPFAGISFDNCTAGTVNNNTINNFQNSVSVFNSDLPQGDGKSTGFSEISAGNEKLKIELEAAEKNILAISTGGKNKLTYPEGIKLIVNKLFGEFKTEQEPVLPNEFSLSQNFPNPFNPVTAIKYGLPKAGNVTLKVYDLLGREVSVLVNEMKQPGIYSVEFNASNYASGIYLYRIESGGFTDVKKMLLVK